jgi:hypothetical protein
VDPRRAVCFSGPARQRAVLLAGSNKLAQRRPRQSLLALAKFGLELVSRAPLALYVTRTGLVTLDHLGSDAGVSAHHILQGV